MADETEAFFIPFRTTAVYPFSFPFGRKVNLKNAIALNFKPLLGERESSVSMIPQITDQRPNLTRGAAWFTSKDEIEEYEARLGGKALFMPAPMAFAAEVDGTGLIVWHENGGSAALWLEEYTPQLYRYVSDGEESPEGLAQWMRAYASSTGGEIAPESVRIFEGGEISREELQKAAEASMEASPCAARLDFSNSGATLAEQYESFFNGAFHALKLLSAAGLFFLILASVLLAQNLYMRGSFAAAPGEIYRLATGDESRSPLSSITRELRALSGGGVQLTLEGVLINIASAWEELPSASGVKLDAIRYGRERTEVEGNAPKTENIQQLRDVLSKNGFEVRLGDVQQIPGGGMRFSLYLTEGGRRQ